MVCMTRAFDFLQIGRSMLLSLLLLVVAAHAASPLGQPLERAPGSAFSAATHDVAVTAGATLTIIKRIAPAALPLPALVPVIAATRSAPIERAASGDRTRQTGPPAAETSFSPLAARAPPAA